jgi:hypothetical protein
MWFPLKCFIDRAGFEGHKCSHSFFLLSINPTRQSREEIMMPIYYTALKGDSTILDQYGSSFAEI